MVRNGKGPVAGLTKNDFTLLEKGKPREIALFKVTDSRTAPLVEPPPPLPPGMVSNRAPVQSARTVLSPTVVLVDHMNTPTDAQIYGNKQLLKFVESAPEGSSIAIYLMTEDGVQIIEGLQRIGNG